MELISPRLESGPASSAPALPEPEPPHAATKKSAAMAHALKNLFPFSLTAPREFIINPLISQILSLEKLALGGTTSKL
jgi:hypothetical protein